MKKSLGISLIVLAGILFWICLGWTIQSNANAFVSFLLFVIEVVLCGIIMYIGISLIDKIEK